MGVKLTCSELVVVNCVIALIKEDQRPSLPCSVLCEHSAKMAVCNQDLTRHEICQCLDLAIAIPRQ